MAALVLAIILVSSSAYFQGVPVAAATAPNIVAPTVSGSINAQSPGTESFWSQLTPLAIPLTATNSYGGAVPSAAVKMANNGTHLLFSVTWSDPTQTVNRAGVAASDPAYPGLFFANSTVHGFDQLAVWWSLQQNPGPPPCMQVGTNQHGGHSPAALTGSGNLWRWTASSSDSGGANWKTAKYGAGTPLAGHLINYTHSFAINLLLNTTGFYTLGYGSSNINSTVGTDSAKVPYQNQMVYAKGVYDNSTKAWTLVVARPLVTNPSTDIQQFALGQTYYFALGAFDGGAHPIPAGAPAPAGWTQMQDQDMTKSISTWFTMQLSPNAPGAITTTTSGQTPSTVTSTVTNTATTTAVSTTTTTATTTVTSSVITMAAYVGAIATLIVGLVAGMVVVSGGSRRKT